MYYMSSSFLDQLLQLSFYIEHTLLWKQQTREGVRSHAALKGCRKVSLHPSVQTWKAGLQLNKELGLILTTSWKLILSLNEFNY